MQIKKLTGLLLLVILTIWGCGQSGDQKSSANEQAPQKEQIEVAKESVTPSNNLDKYGRNSSDPHYGHDHPSQEPSSQKIDSVQTPTTGEPDQFGRKPGDQHYGHSHQ